MHKKSKKYSPPASHCRVSFAICNSFVASVRQIPPFSIAKLPSLFAISPINLATECGHCADRRRRRSRARPRPSVRPSDAGGAPTSPSAVANEHGDLATLRSCTRHAYEDGSQPLSLQNDEVLHFNRGKKSSEQLPLPRPPCGFTWAARNTMQKTKDQFTLISL